MRYTTAILSMTLILSCRSQLPPVKEVPILYRDKIVERLVPVSAPADSASISALFACDSLNRVILRSISELKGKSVQSRYTYYAGALKYNFATSPSPGYARVKDSIIYREVPVKVPVEVKVNELTWWQKTQIKLFWLLCALTGAQIARYILSSKINW